MIYLSFVSFPPFIHSFIPPFLHSSLAGCISRSGVPTNIPLLSDKLKELGFSTHVVGKWHLGFYNNASCPWMRGFDSTFGYLTGAEDYENKTVQGFFDFRAGTTYVFCATRRAERNTRACTVRPRTSSLLDVLFATYVVHGSRCSVYEYTF